MTKEAGLLREVPRSTSEKLLQQQKSEPVSGCQLTLVRHSVVAE